MPMSLREWHEQVAPHLRDIEEISHQIEARCRWLSDALGHLPVRPSWPTKAEDALSVAAAALNNAVNQVERVRKQYAAKTVLPFESFTPKANRSR